MEPVTLAEAQESGLLDKLCCKVLKKHGGRYEFSTRANSRVEYANIATIVQLVVRTPREIRDASNFGSKSFNEIQATLQDDGLEFGMDFSYHVRMYLDNWVAEQGLPPLDTWIKRTKYCRLSKYPEPIDVPKILGIARKNLETEIQRLENEMEHGARAPTHDEEFRRAERLISRRNALSAAFEPVNDKTAIDCVIQALQRLKHEH